MDNRNLRNVGLKVTQPRKRILELLEERPHKHVTADDIYRFLMQAGEDIGLATVYRVLTQFEGAGLVTRHNFETGHSVFEIAKGAHHDHMVCIETGDVIEFHDDVIEERQKQIAERHGYTLEDHALVLYVRKKPE